MAVAEEMGHDVTVVEYLKERPDRDTLERLIAMLDDPATDLVRRDSQFRKLALTEADVETAEQIVELLVDKPRLLQRPVVVMGERAIIGRPKARVVEFLSPSSA